MAYQKRGRKFGRTRDRRNAFLRSLASNLIRDGRVRTTEARSKEVRRIVERAITKGKKQDLHAYRTIARSLSAPAARKIYGDLSLTYRNRPGGYTRITKLGPRTGDGARMAIIELVE